MYDEWNKYTILYYSVFFQSTFGSVMLKYKKNWKINCGILHVKKGKNIYLFLFCYDNMYSVTMRRMMEDERPLPLLLCWADEGVRILEYNKFVLQENDTGEILVSNLLINIITYIFSTIIFWVRTLTVIRMKRCNSGFNTYSCNVM